MITVYNENKYTKLNCESLNPNSSDANGSSVHPPLFAIAITEKIVYPLQLIKYDNRNMFTMVKLIFKLERKTNTTKKQLAFLTAVVFVSRS